MFSRKPGERLARAKAFCEALQRYPKRLRNVIQNTMRRRSRSKGPTHEPISTVAGEIHPGHQASTRPHNTVPYSQSLPPNDIQSIEDVRYIGTSNTRMGHTASATTDEVVSHQELFAANAFSVEGPGQSLAVPPASSRPHSRQTSSSFLALTDITKSELPSSNSSVHSPPDDYKDPSRLDICVFRHNGTPSNTVLMRALLDTGFEGSECLMNDEHFQKLNIPELEPYEGEIEAVDGGRVAILGIARGLVWQVEHGWRTYKSDFIIVDLPKYDVLINNQTIWKNRLFEAGADVAYHLARAAETALIFYPENNTCGLNQREEEESRGDI